MSGVAVPVWSRELAIQREIQRLSQTGTCCPLSYVSDSCMTGHLLPAVAVQSRWDDRIPDDCCLYLQTSACEKVIRRDIARTYPEHEFFMEKNGLGQESLFNVMKVWPFVRSLSLAA